MLAWLRWRRSLVVEQALASKRHFAAQALRLVLFTTVLGAVGYLVFDAVDSWVGTDSLHVRIAETEHEIAELRMQADQLAALAAYLDSDEFVERVAREDLGFVRPGEEAFAVEAPVRPGLRILRAPWWVNLLPDSRAPITD